MLRDEGERDQDRQHQARLGCGSGAFAHGRARAWSPGLGLLANGRLVRVRAVCRVRRDRDLRRKRPLKTHQCHSSRRADGLLPRLRNQWVRLRARNRTCCPRALVAAHCRTGRPAHRIPGRRGAGGASRRASPVIDQNLRRRRRRTVVLVMAVVIVLVPLLWPWNELVVPEWTVTVTTQGGHPAPNVASTPARNAIARVITAVRTRRHARATSPRDNTSPAKNIAPSPPCAAATPGTTNPPTEVRRRNDHMSRDERTSRA